MNQARYVFGGSAEETARLRQLGELLAPSTRRVLRDAGVGEGMRVLDAGCGPGSVTFLAAELVGPAGSVTGIDRDPAMLAAARAHARAIGQRAVSFVEADLAGLDGEAWLAPGFDAIIGRLILLHVPDPGALLRALVRHLRPGGVMVFSEPDLIRMGASFPAMPALEQLCDWARQAHRSLGIDCQFGLRLQQLFRDAGLPAPRLRCEAFIGGGPDWEWYDQMIAAARNALPVVVSAGITTAGQADIDALEEQVRAVAASQHTVTRAIDLITAWSETVRPHPDNRTREVK